MSATKVLGISGLSALGELPASSSVDVHKEVGDSLDWRKGSLDKIFQVTGTVTSYEELARHHELLVRGLLHLVRARPVTARRPAGAGADLTGDVSSVCTM